MDKSDRGKFIKLVITAIVLFGMISGFGQGLNGPPNIKFKYITKGLSQNSINCILQDHKGFMWFGTQDGLHKYNGYEFIIYKNNHNDPGSLNSNAVYSLFEDQEGKIWIGTQGGGLNLYDSEKDSFIHYKHDDSDKNSLSHNSVFSIFEDSKGRFWIGTDGGGLNLFDKNKGTFVQFKHNINNANSLSHNTVWVMSADPQRTLWIGTLGGRYNKFDYSKNLFKNYKHDENSINSLSNNVVRSIFEDQSGDLWICTEGGGLNLFDRNNEVFKVFRHNKEDITTISNDRVWGIFEDTNRNFWVGTDGGGLNLFDRENRVFHHYKNDGFKQSINNNVIRNIYEDRKGGLWIGTYTGGVNVIHNDDEKLLYYGYNQDNNKGLSNPSVLSICESKYGGFWIGTDGGGLNYFDIENNKFVYYKHDEDDPNSISDNVVLSVIEDDKGDLWIGTFTGGLNRFNVKNKKFDHYKYDENNNKSINDNSVWVVYEDGRGDIWIGTNGSGIGLLNKETSEFTRFQHDAENPKSLSENTIRAIYEDSYGDLWIGTTGGVNKFNRDNSSFIRYVREDNDEFSLSNDRVVAFHEDINNNFWLGTYGGGLALLDRETGSFTAFRETDGLPNDVVYGILEDAGNNLWLSTNKGISQFNPRIKSYKNYETDDGLQDNQFNRGAFLKDRGGRMWFGGINGFNVFHPDSLSDNQYIPPIEITDFKLFNKSLSIGGTNSVLQKHISETKKIILRHDQSVFSFEFVALSYTHPERNNYAYKLEGFEDEWNYVGTQRTAAYTNLNPGEYVFKVKGSNNDGLWNDEGSSIRVIILPPWWNTWWARVIYFLFAVFILFGLRQLVINRERLKTNLKLEHLELTHLKEIDQLKTRFYANISHELRTPLTLILGHLNSLYTNESNRDSADKLKVAIQNAQRLTRLINQLLDLSKLEIGNMKLEASRANVIKFLKEISASFTSLAEQRQIVFISSFSKEPLFVYFDRDKLEKIIINLLSNAFKFTPKNGVVNLSISKVNPEFNESPGQIVEEGYLEIAIKDNGIGIPEDLVKHIFDRFYQVDCKSNNMQEGTGIGLSITKELVELHKGKINVHSRNGQGSTFKVLLPLGKDHLEPSEIIQIKDELSETVRIIGLEENGNEKSVSEKNITQLKANDNAPIILIVEDNKDLRSYLRENLESDYCIIESENGKEGHKTAIKEIPDLIISDVMMPEMDGFELCKLLKNDKRTCHIPFILLTAKAGLNNEITALEQGADDYIIKPFDVKILKVRVQSLLKSRDLLHEHFTSAKMQNLEPKEIYIAPNDQALLNNSLACIEKNMSNPELNVELLGREVGLSRMQLYRKLKALTGNSANEFIRTIRLKRAAQLIKQKQHTIAEVTYEVGFNDLQYFRDCFKKQFGINPSEYSKNESIQSKSLAINK